MERRVSGIRLALALAILVLAIAWPATRRHVSAQGPTIWQPLANSPTANNLYGAMLTSSTSGWAVGDTPPFGNGDATILQFTGNPATPWITAPGTSNLTPNPLRAVAVDPITGNAWAVGASGTTVHFVASTNTWSVVSDSATANQLNAVAIVSDTAPNVSVWAVDTNGKIIHFDGTQWTVSQTVTGQPALEGITIVSSTDGWIVGTGATILRFNGSTWTSVTPPTGDDYESVAIDASTNGSSTDGWIVGSSGALLRFNGTTWSQFTSTPPTTNELLSVSMISPTAGWAVGESGAIVAWDGNSWSLASSPVTAQYPWTVATDSTGDAWIVGSNGAILQNALAPTATSTPDVTTTPTMTGTATATATASSTGTVTDTPTVTTTGTSTSTPTSTSTGTSTRTPTSTHTPQPTRTPTDTRTPTSTKTPTLSPTPSNTRTPVPTRTPTNTRTPVPTRTPNGGAVVNSSAAPAQPVDGGDTTSTDGSDATPTIDASATQ